MFECYDVSLANERRRELIRQADRARLIRALGMSGNPTVFRVLAGRLHSRIGEIGKHLRNRRDSLPGTLSGGYRVGRGVR